MAEPDSGNDDKGSDAWSIAPPPFDAAAAMQTLQRSLRDARLVERAGGFETKGRRVVELALGDGCIEARLAKRLALTPEWDRSTVRNQGELKRFLDEVKRRLARWQDED
jgi:hypothetical protein